MQPLHPLQMLLQRRDRTCRQHRHSALPPQGNRAPQSAIGQNRGLWPAGAVLRSSVTHSRKAPEPEAGRPPTGGQLLLAPLSWSAPHWKKYCTSQSNHPAWG
jgi:hypothetical protein